MHPRFRTAPFVLLALSAHWAWCGPNEIRKPPVGETLTVEAMRGGRAEITLKAYEGRNNPLAYEIVRAPRHGALSDFRQADANRQGFASVIYTHGDDENSYEDDFAFRARPLGGGVSSPITVKIRIVDEPPRLAAPARLEFTAVAGESELQLVGLTNAGGAVLEGNLRPEKPFHVDGDGSFRLGRGQSTNLAVRFSPTSADFVPQQKLAPAPGDPSAFVVLSGEAKAPFAVRSEAVELRADGSRESEVTVTNFCAFPSRLAFTFRPDGVAEAAPELEVPAGGTRSLPVRIGPEKKGGAFELFVRVADAFHAQELTLQVPAVPPKLDLITPELDFRTDSETFLAVRNSGGVPGRFTLDLPPGLKNLEGAASISVPPGEAARLRLRLERPPESGEASLVAMVDLGNSDKVPVPVLLPAAKPKSAPATVENLRPDQALPPPPPKKPWALDEDVKLHVTADGTAIIHWVAAKGGWTNAQLEIVDARGARVYRGESPVKNWWNVLADWLTGSTAGAEAAIEEKREFFERRLKVPGEDETAPPAVDGDAAEWRNTRLAAADWRNTEVTWRIVAQREVSSPEAVSESFKSNAAGDALQTVPEPRAKTFPQLPAKRTVSLPLELPIKPLSWSPARDGATITFEMPSGDAVANYRFQRLQRFFGPDPETGHARVTYESEPFPEQSVELLGRKSVEREGIGYDEVTVRFSGLESGTQVFWRAVPLAGNGEEQTPSGILHFWTVPPPPFPVRSVALTLCATALVAVLVLRWRARRAGG